MTMNNCMLHDDRIKLRAIEPEDLEIIFQIENNPELWQVSCSTVPYSRYAIKQYIANTSNDIYADRELRLMVEDIEVGHVVGCVDLSNFDPLHGRAEIGMVVLNDERGRGIGSRALKLLCQYAFRFLHLHQLYAYVPADNQASLKMFTNVGFERHLLLVDWLCVKDESGLVYKDAFMIQCLSN